MDQVKAALAWLKTHHFWVLSAIVIATVVGVWYTASASVASQTKAQRGKIDSQISSIQGLLRQPFKPNDEINSKQKEHIQKLSNDVLTEWSNLYGRQKEEVLIWPEALGERFIKSVKDAEFGDAIRSQQREVYQNYIKETFPSLVEIVDAELLDDKGGGGRRGSGGGEYGGGRGGPGGRQDPDLEAGETYLVEWLDQADLRSRFELAKEPTALQIWVLQEDLWVYRALLQAIAATNEATGAVRRDRAAVQTITELKVGQSAGGDDPTVARLATPDSSGAAIASGGGGYGGGEYGGGYGGGEYGGGGGYGGGEYGGGGGEYGGGGGEYGGGGYGGGGYGGGGGAVADGDDPGTALLAGRYLGDDDKPMEVTGPPFNFGREFKRLPVRMVLEMDSKWLSQLMWELANAPLQVEVEQVRFNPDAKGRNNRGGEVEAFDRRPTFGTVTLKGVIYIFNQPDPTIAQFEEE